MARCVPNFITTGRILLSAGLLLLKPQSVPFFVAYLLCGLSDIADGYIARKMGTASPFGAALDSVADFVFLGVMLFIYVPRLHLPLWVIAWVCVIAFIRIAALAVGWAKYRTIAFLHTFANKATGMALILFPLLELSFGIVITAVLLCGIASISAVEELAIQCVSKELNRDARSLFRLL